MGVQFDATPRSGVDSSGIAVSSASGLGGTVAVRVTVDDAVITSKQDAILAIGAIRREIQRQPYPAVSGGGAPVLGDLTLSGTLANGTASSGTIIGATTASTITSNVTGLTVNSGARTYSWDGTGAAGTTANGLVETLAGATGSPKDNPITVIAVPWILASGSWDDSAPWDDNQLWKDAT